MPARTSQGYETVIVWDTSSDVVTLSDFLSRLAALRESLGVTQAELSRRTGICRSQISAFENNRREPTVSILQRYVRGLGGRLTADLGGPDED